MSKWAFQILASLTLLTTMAVGIGRPQDGGAPGDEHAGPSDGLDSRIVIPEPKLAADAQSTRRMTVTVASPFANAKPAVTAKPAAAVPSGRAAVSIVDAEPSAVVAANRVSPVSGEKERVSPVSGETERVSLASAHRPWAVAAESVQPLPPPPPQASASPSDIAAEPQPEYEACDENGDCCGRVCACPLCGACNMPQHYASFPAMHGYYYFRPYHYSHIAKHQQIAASWGADPRFPYSNEIFKTVYAQYRKDRAQPAAPKAPGSP